MARARPIVHLVLTLAVLEIALLAVPVPSASGQAAPLRPGGSPASLLDQADSTRLPGHVLDLVARATPLPDVQGDGDLPITFAVVLRRPDEAAFQAFLRSVNDPRSPDFRRFAGRDELVRRFGPSQQAYDAVMAYLMQSGFSLVDGSTNRMMIVVRGTRGQVNRVLGAQIRSFPFNGAVQFANTADPAVPAALAPSILAIVGLNSFARPHSAAAPAALLPEPGPDSPRALLPEPGGDSPRALLPEPGADSPRAVLAQGTPTPTSTPTPRALTGLQIAAAYNAPGVVLPSGTPATGANQIIGLTEFAAFNGHNIRHWLQSTAGPCLTPSTQAACVQGFETRLTINTVGGSRDATATLLPTPAPAATSQGEPLLDIAAVMSVAPGANYTVFQNSGANFGAALVHMLNQMIPQVNVVSSSWFYCENFITTSDLNAYNQVLSQAPALGVPVVFATGDVGTDCYTGRPDTRTFPTTTQYVIAVGGTILTVDASGAYYSEQWWNSGTGSGHDCYQAFNFNVSFSPDNDGCGSYGLSALVPAPPWQLPYLPSPTPTMRSIPDVVAVAYPGIIIHLDGTQVWHGTSLAAPVWAASLALINQVNGTPTVPLLPKLYSLANTNAFHPPGSMVPATNVPGPTTDFAHLGLGSPNLPNLAALLGGSPTATTTPLPTASRTLTPTLHPLTQTAIALTGTATPTLHPGTATAIVQTATIQALTATATPTIHPGTATAIVQTATIQALTATATPTIHPGTATAAAATATIQALTATATHLPATQTVIALTRTSTPVSAPTTPPNAPITSGTPGVPAASTIGQTIVYSSGGSPNGVNGSWTLTGSGAFVFTATNTNAAIVPGSIPVLTLPTTAGNESGTPLAGQPTVCTAVGATPPFTTTCRGTTVGNVLLGAQVTVTFATATGGTTTSTGQQVAGTTAQNLTPAQAQTQAHGTAGFQTGPAGVPCASAGGALVGPLALPGLAPATAGQTCAVSGAVSGTLTRTGSMSFTLTATVPAGVIAGVTPVAVFSTDQGLQAVACAAAAGAAGTAYTCSGAIAGNALQGSTAALCFTAGTPCLLGTVTGPGVALGANPLPPLFLLPPPPAPLLPPPPLLVPPTPPALPAGPGPLAPAPFADVPVIPEATSGLLLGLGVALLGLLAGWRGTRRRLD